MFGGIQSVWEACSVLLKHIVKITFYLCSEGRQDDGVFSFYYGVVKYFNLAAIYYAFNTRIQLIKATVTKENLLNEYKNKSWFLFFCIFKMWRCFIKFEGHEAFGHTHIHTYSPTDPRTVDKEEVESIKNTF